MKNKLFEEMELKRKASRPAAQKQHLKRLLSCKFLDEDEIIHCTFTYQHQKD